MPSESTYYSLTVSRTARSVIFNNSARECGTFRRRSRADKESSNSFFFNSELNTVVAHHQIRAGTYAVFRSHHERNFVGTVSLLEESEQLAFRASCSNESLGSILEISRAPDYDPTLID
jgi:hypothetical protein